MNTEQELDNHRKDCLDALLYCVRERSAAATKEAANSYKIAINAHTIEYLNNREILYESEKIRKILRY